MNIAREIITSLGKMIRSGNYYIYGMGHNVKMVATKPPAIVVALVDYASKYEFSVVDDPL